MTCCAILCLCCACWRKHAKIKNQMPVNARLTAATAVVAAAGFIIPCLGQDSRPYLIGLKHQSLCFMLDASAAWIHAMVCFIRGCGGDMDHGRKANLYSANAVSVVGIASASVPPSEWRRVQRRNSDKQRELPGYDLSDSQQCSYYV